MSLYNRLSGKNDEPKISPHQFTGLAGEFGRGRITDAQAIASFSPPLSAQEQTDATNIVNRVLGGQLTRDEVSDVLYLVELNLIYTTEASFKSRLGIP